MRAFHNDNKIKKKYLNRVKMHRKADELIQGIGWENGKGCAVGCTLNSYDHSQYPIELGIPEWLAIVEDTIFEGLSKKNAMLWSERFLKSINPGANLDKIKGPFLIFALQRVLEILDPKKFPEVLQSINSVIDLWTIGGTEQDFRDAAASAYDSAYYVAYDSIYAATAYAATAAYDSLYVAYAATAVYECLYADTATYKNFADKLIQLLENC